MNELFVERSVSMAEHPVLQKLFTVVGRKNDQRVLSAYSLLEGPNEPLNGSI